MQKSQQRIRENVRTGVRSGASIQQKLNEQWDHYYYTIKERMTGTDEQKDFIIRRRIQRFFQDYKLKTDQYYTKRKDIDPTSIDLGLIFQNTLLLYGIDYLTNEDIRLYFAPYLVNICKYDNSHCAVEFTDVSQLLECLNTKLIAKCESPQILEAVFKNHREEMVRWREVIGYTEMVFERKLWVRFLTKEDCFENNSGCPNRFILDLYNKAKLDFLHSVNKKIKTRSHSRKKRWKYSQIPKIQEKAEESYEKQCYHCDEKIRHVKKMYPCKHKSEKQANHIHQQKHLSFKIPQRNVQNIKPFIEKLTGTTVIKNKQEEKSNNSGSGIEPARPRQTQGSELYSEMVHEFSRYDIFKGDGESNLSEIPKNQSGEKSFLNKSDISLFEKYEDDV